MCPLQRAQYEHMRRGCVGQFKYFIYKTVAEWLAHLLHIWEVPGSNLCTERGYPH
jgi:hypothetical protein